MTHREAARHPELFFPQINMPDIFFPLSIPPFSSNLSGFYKRRHFREVVIEDLKQLFRKYFSPAVKSHSQGIHSTACHHGQLDK